MKQENTRLYAFKLVGISTVVYVAATDYHTARIAVRHKYPDRNISWDHIVRSFDLSNWPKVLVEA